jgi:adenylate kinase
MPVPFRPKISLIGPPGSGKGSYGRLLAKCLSIPLITASTLLKQAKLDTSSGKLLDDATVSKILLDNLPQQQHSYFLDGFPRTMNQVKLMERDWPTTVQAAISLDVPRQVCFEKLVGRRLCHICDRNWNVAGVQYGKFIMPPSLPESCNRCDQSDWIQRPDDKPDIIKERLDIFYETTEPILEHYEAKGTLLRFAPYGGFSDMPRFQSTVADWIVGLERRLGSSS